MSKSRGEDENFARVMDDTSAVARCELDRLSSRQTRCAEFTAHRACMRARHNHCNFTDFLFLSPWESHVRRVNLHLRRLLFCHLNPVCNLSSLERTRKKIYVNMDYGQWKENYGSCLTKGEYDWSMYPIRIINIVILSSLFCAP